MSTGGLVSKFERQNFSRIVMSGHGCFFATDGNIAVPEGMTIHFYVHHGDLTDNAVGMAVENRFASAEPPQPVDTYSAGQLVHNYRLSFGSRLDLAGSLSTYKYDWITVDDVDRMVPLSVLLRDPRCKAPCTIHWAACREIKHDQIGKNDKYVTRPLQSLRTAGKSLDLVDSSGAKTTHTSTIPGRVAIPTVFTQ